MSFFNILLYIFTIFYKILGAGLAKICEYIEVLNG